jgi:glycine/D-amino acid oxidase-like deaminating enzyme
MAANGSAEPKKIVVVGGGIIGSTSAYFLSHHPSFDPSRDSITILESTKIAGGASGKAGGLLALWAYPSCIVPLSYRLHKELAEKHGGEERWGYRGVSCGSIECYGRPIPAKSSVKGKKDMPTGEDAEANGSESVSLKKRSPEALALLEKAGVPKDLDWVDPSGVVDYGSMGTPETTAQVHPYQFTTSMAKLAEEKGVKVVFGHAIKISQSLSGSRPIDGVLYTQDSFGGIPQALKATHVILAAGPWTQTLWPKAPISATRAHSVTIRPTRPVSAYALFTQIELPKDFTAARTSVAKKRSKGLAQVVTPEIYARPNNEVYACGEGDHTVPLPATSDKVQVDEQRCQDIVDYVGSISDELRDGEVTARQACYLPSVTSGGGPIIGETSVKGLIVAAGHTCWGIQNAPATGKLVSEIVFEGGAKSANIGSLSPRKFGL